MIDTNHPKTLKELQVPAASVKGNNEPNNLEQSIFSDKQKFYFLPKLKNCPVWLMKRETASFRLMLFCKNIKSNATFYNMTVLYQQYNKTRKIT